MALPTFRYHPDPLATGSLEASDTRCVCCGEARGYVYLGPVYAKEEYDACLCPWCIASGAAYETLGASFVDPAGVGGYGHWDAVPREVTLEVACRTPGFSGWQQERWWTHCGDAAAFLGVAGAAEVLRHGEATVERLRADLGWEPGAQFDAYLRSLDAKGQPSAYLFRCLHCGEVGGYSDFT